MSSTSQEASATEPVLASTTRVELDPLVIQAAREVDRSLLDWALSLSPRQRLRACSNAGLALRRFTSGSSRTG